MFHTTYLLMISSSLKPTELQRLNSLVHCLVEIKQWLSDNTLQLNVDKTETLVIAPDESIPGLNQYLGDLGQSVKPSLGNLGVVFDKDMSLVQHCKQLTKNCFLVNFFLVKSPNSGKLCHKIIWSCHSCFCVFAFRLL